MTIKICFVPQRQGAKGQIEYSFSGEIVTVKIDNEENSCADTFDFSGLPDGELDKEREVETVLPVCPIIFSKRVDGVLHLELLNWIGRDAPYESRFPEWVELPLPRPKEAGKGNTPERTAVIPWRAAQEIEMERQAVQAGEQEREDRRARIKSGLNTARTIEELKMLLDDMAAEMGLKGAN